MRPDGRRLVATVAVFFPDQIPRAVFVADGHRVNRAVLLADERPVICVRPARARRRHHRDAERAAFLVTDVVNVISATVVRNLRRPVIAVRPCRALLHGRADHLPVNQVARMQQRKQRRPLRRRRRRPVIIADANDRRVRVIAGHHRVRISGARLRRNSRRAERG